MTRLAHSAVFLVACLAAGAGLPAAAGPLRVPVGDCVLEAPPALESDLRHLAARAAELLPRLEADLGVRARGPYRMILIPASGAVDPEVGRLDGRAPSWAAGYLFPALRVGGIRMRAARRYPHDDTASVLVHEATHMLLHDAAGGNLPRWFGEGVASWEGRRWGLRDLVVYSSGLLTGSLPALGELDGRFAESGGAARVAYAASFDFVSWSMRRHGPDLLRRVVAEARSGPLPGAWERATGASLAADERAWRRSSLLWYRWLPALLGTGTVWMGITLLAFLAGARRRARSREIQARWDAEDGPPGPPRPGPSPPGGYEVH